MGAGFRPGFRFLVKKPFNRKDDTATAVFQEEIGKITESEEALESIVWGFPEIRSDLMTRKEIETISNSMEVLKSKRIIDQSTFSESSTSSIEQLESNVFSYLIEANLILLNEVKKTRENLEEHHQKLEELYESTIRENSKLRKELEGLKNEISIRFTPPTLKDLDKYSENLDKDY